jgi:predicted DNA-binding protein with PD1-like motif
MESKKFYIVITSVVILAFFYFSSIGLLFIIPNAPEFISGFVTIFSKTIEILAIIIASYVGAQAVVDLRYQSGSNVDLESATVKEEEEVTVLHTNMKEDDYELK